MSVMPTIGALKPIAAPPGPVLIQQQTSIGQLSSGTLTLTLGKAPVSGNTLVMFCASSNGASIAAPSGWTLLSNSFVGATTGARMISTRTATGTEGTTITGPTFASGYSNFCVQEWQGSRTLVAAEAGNAAASTGGFGAGPLAAPASTGVPCIFVSFSGASPTTTFTWPAGWTGIGPLPNGSFPYAGAGIGYDSPTASAVSAITCTYTGTRGNGTTVLWVAAWVS